MRIIGSISHPRFKITVFRMGTRLALKLEDGLCEQVFKFREGVGMGGFEDVKGVLDDGFLAEVVAVFEAMQGARLAAWQRYAASLPGFDEFEDFPSRQYKRPPL